DDEAGPRRVHVLQLQRAARAGDLVEVDYRGILLGREVAQGVGVADRQDAVVDGGLAAVAVAADVAEDKLAGAFLADAKAGGAVGDLAGDRQGAGAAAQGAVAVEGDGPGP